MKISLFGKHPSINEYIHEGENSMFMNSVIHWIEKGYETCLQNRTLEKLTKIQHFCFINTQQAPSPVQSAFVLPTKLASIIAH